MSTPYVARRESQSRLLPVRGLQMHVHLWGDPAEATPERPLRVLMHGWMDIGASFQFVVDALAEQHGDTGPVAAADWRGFGRSSAGSADAYWFPDYLGDLDALLDALSPGQPVDLLGHSMGGNVVMAYAGVRPQRVRRLVNMEGFGLPDSDPADAPARLATWLDELKTPQHFRSYGSEAEVVARLQQQHPRLGAARAAWLAPHWAERRDDGRWHVRGDPAHRRTNPVPYRAAEAIATWRRIGAPTLWIEGAETDLAQWWKGRYTYADFEARLTQVATLRRERIAECAHMLHFDQPARVAALLHDFWR